MSLRSRWGVVNLDGSTSSRGRELVFGILRVPFVISGIDRQLRVDEKLSSR